MTIAPHPKQLDHGSLFVHQKIKKPALSPVKFQGTTLPPGTRQAAVIGRRLSEDFTRELFDTRLAPGDSATFRYRRRLPGAGLALRVAVTVYPDHFYVGFFEALLAGGAGKGTAQVREALRAARSSSFTLYVNEVPLT